MPESNTHSDFKYDMYWDIIQNDQYAQPEKNIGHTRTDVLTEINNHLVAIEIQHTRIPIPSILRRMREHTYMGAHTLWLITQDALQLDSMFCRNLNWVLFIQKLQGGVIFIPHAKQTIIPARIDNSVCIRRNQLVAGTKKILEQHTPISLADLSFYAHECLNVNISTLPIQGNWWDYLGDLF